MELVFRDTTTRYGGVLDEKVSRTGTIRKDDIDDGTAKKLNRYNAQETIDYKN